MSMIAGSDRVSLPDALRGLPPVVEMLAAEMVFRNGVRGLAPTELAIGAGEFVSLIGPSGCGKSTLLKMVARLDEPTDGRVQWWRGAFERVGEPGRRLAFVFQDATLMPWADVRTNVRLPLDLRRMPRVEADARVTGALRHVGLETRDADRPHLLSGGMRMRVSIARALAIDPDLLLMDEPFGALDEFTRNRLDDELSALTQQRSLTTLFVTHSIAQAVFLSSRVLVMAAEPGRIVAEHTIDAPFPRGAAWRADPRFAQHCLELMRKLDFASGHAGALA